MIVILSYLVKLKENKIENLNPLQTIPMLFDKRAVITGSHIICRYLVDTLGCAFHDSYYPKEIVQRFRVDARLNFNCGRLFLRIRAMVEPVIYFGADKIEEEKVLYMQQAYDGLEKCLASSTYLCGEYITIADFCCVATVSTAMLFAPIKEEKYPHVKPWVKRLSKLPYYKKCNQEAADSLFKFVQAQLVENKKVKSD